MARRDSDALLTEPSAGKEAPLVLFVDDSPDARVTYGEYLFGAGYRVAVAADGNEALALAMSVIPDLVLLDLEMPGLDGWEAARLLKSYWHTCQVPIVALSGYHDHASVARAISAGCSRFVTKPCASEELERIIRLTLRERAQQHGVV
jgi:two-component system cell cycle response regulator DivK